LGNRRAKEAVRKSKLKLTEKPLLYTLSPWGGREDVMCKRPRATSIIQRHKTLLKRKRSSGKIGEERRKEGAPNGRIREGLSTRGGGLDDLVKEKKK